jgi:hypothetical protein
MDQDYFQGRLLRDEKVVWWGQPAQGFLLTSRDWLLVPFGLLWAGFVIFWEWNVLGTNAPVFMKIWGAPFVLVGLYLLAGRFVLDAWIRGGTYYAVTNQRVLMLRSRPSNKFTSISLDQLPVTNLTESSDGRGTIRFGPEATYFASRGFSGWTPSLDPTPQFIAIDDARSVFDHIQRSVARIT